MSTNIQSPRRDFLLDHCHNNILLPADGEKDCEYAFRLVRETRGSDFSLQVLAECIGLEKEELVGLADGTLWRTDDPYLSEPSVAECVESFLQRVEEVMHARGGSG